MFQNKEYNAQETIQSIVELANQARRNGLLSLESSVQSLQDPYLKMGLEMVVDGVDAEQIKETLENHIAGTEERHHVGASMLQTAGTTSPTLGVLGAVIGLIGALGNLNDVDALGSMISAAFVATLYGIFFGYVLFLPFSNRLKIKSQAEILIMMITVEGVLAIQAGQAPKTIEQKLYSLIEPDQRIQSS